jgi:flavin reductase (DIM6/NTAB) family NADH-FMN oxidoreductase RutF
MISISPKDISTKQLHAYLLGAVAPRPIAFASTIDGSGNVNLSPFSFFNVFSANPPILIFSPARRVRDNTLKHTLENVMETKEVAINIVNYDMVQQMSLSSSEYERGVNEFKKSGLTELASEVIKPPRVAESPVQFECRVNEIVSLGGQGGAGNLVISEVVRIHIKEEILDPDGRIDPRKIDAVSRMGGNWYSRAKEGLFEVQKPIHTLGIGVDALPDVVKYSKVLTGNDLGNLGNVESLPTTDEVNAFIDAAEEFKNMVAEGDRDRIHGKAKELLKEEKTMKAWKLLLADINWNS